MIDNGQINPWLRLLTDSVSFANRAPEFDTSRVILGIFGAIVLRNQALRKVARNCLYWQT
ncbi:MAG: hypothetical protein EBT56_16540 [Betaproteobacteria bacterium]|nr:hypothetical protein [Betaproteobacteria bacterium]